MNHLDAFGIGNALIDFVVEVDEDTIARLDLRKGVMQLVEEREFLHIVDFVNGKKVTILPGGSSANTMIGMARLGAKTAFSGSVGGDFRAGEYARKMRQAGVAPHVVAKKAITGTCVSLVTPDKERTMATCLAASSMLEPGDLSWGAMEKAKILHLEGYQLSTKSQAQVVRQALAFAKRKGLLVSFDCADPFVVRRYRKEIQGIIRKSADVVFLNEAEARELTGLPATKAIRRIAKRKGQAVALKIGRRGSLVWKDGKVHRIPVHKVDAKDTTGAGDLYAGGFLFGMARGLDAKACGMHASYLAGEIVAQFGAYLKPLKKGGLKSWMRQRR